MGRKTPNCIALFLYYLTSLCFLFLLKLTGQFYNGRVMPYKSERRMKNPYLALILLSLRHFYQQSPHFWLVVCNNHAHQVVVHVISLCGSQDGPCEIEISTPCHVF